MIIVFSIVALILALEPLKVNANEPEIPVVQNSGEEPTPVGFQTDEEVDWGEEETPKFLYSLDMCEKFFRVRGIDKYIIRNGNVYMLISLKGSYGPVWEYTVTELEDIVAITAKHFIFKDEKNVLAIEFETGNQQHFENLSQEEKDSWHDLKEVQIKPFKSARIDSWTRDYVEWQLIDNATIVHIEFQEDMYERSEDIFLSNQKEWYRFSGDRLFFVQSSPGEETEKEAVFIGGMNGAKRAIIIPFEGEFLLANQWGILYTREGKRFFKSYFPLMVSGYDVYPELPASIFLLDIKQPSVVNIEGGEESTILDGSGPF